MHLFESEAEMLLLGKAVEAAVNAIVISDLNGHILWVNPAFSRITGYSRSEAVGRHTRILRSGKHDRAFFARLWNTILAGNVFEAEMVNRRKDGSNYIEHNTITPVLGPNGQVQHFIAVKEDITDRKRAEEARRQSEERFRLLFEYAPDAFYLHDLNGVFVDGNKGAENLIGYARQELIGKSFPTLNLISPGDLHLAMAALERNRKGEAAGPIELVLNRKDGLHVPVEIRTYPVQVDAGVLVLGIARDITERRLAELRGGVLSDLSVQLNAESSLTVAAKMISEAADKLFHWDAFRIDLEDAGGGGHRTFRASKADGQKKFLSSSDSGGPAESDEQIESDNSMLAVIRHGEIRLGTLQLKYHRRETFTDDDQQRLQLLADHCGAALERIAAREALSESEANYRALIERMPDAVFVHVDKKIVFVNAATVKLLGVESENDLIGRCVMDIVPPENHELVRQRIESCTAGVVNPLLEQKIRRLDGRFIQAEVVSIPFTFKTRPAVQTVLRDVTERRRLEEHLQHSQKLEAIGTLAGGIAHDFNNILGGIMGYTQLASMDSGGDPKIQESLTQVLKAADRARELVAQILTFSRQRKQERTPVRLGTVTKEVLKLLRATLPATIEVTGRVEDSAPVVLADCTQIHQVLMNLCTNAAHAIGTTPGKLEVVLRAEEITEARAREHPRLKPGAYAMLSVRDTGHGIKAEDLKRIFEPFFTTKQPWEGTGLGLSVVHGIVEEHEGVILVRSTPGAGTVFDVFLPSCAGAGVPAESGFEQLPLGNGQHILFVDDEPALAHTARRLLEAIGYRATVETDPARALETFWAKPDQFDLVITDLTMPGMTGIDIARRILSCRPDMPIIIATGFNPSWDSEGLQQSGVRELLMKPLTPKTLAEGIHRALQPARSK